MLSKVSDGIFNKKGNALVKSKIKEWIKKPMQFRLATKCCDGSYHVVNSEVTSILEIGVSRNDVKKAINILAPVDPIHGRRYMIFEENPTGVAYLLGTVERAILEISRHGQ